MDGSRFDDLARRFGRVNRRRLVAGAGGGLAGTALARARTAPPKAEATAPGEQVCERFCTAVFAPDGDASGCLRGAASGTGLCAACGGDPGRVCRDADGTPSCPDLD